MVVCWGFFECLFSLFNFIFIVVGFVMVGYGIYLFVEWMKMFEDGSSGGLMVEVLVFGWLLLGVVVFGDSFFDMLFKVWWDGCLFMYFFCFWCINVGFVYVILWLISILGCEELWGLFSSGGNYNCE